MEIKQVELCALIQERAKHLHKEAELLESAAQRLDSLAFKLGTEEWSATMLTELLDAMDVQGIGIRKGNGK